MNNSVAAAAGSLFTRLQQPFLPEEGDDNPGDEPRAGSHGSRSRTVGFSPGREDTFYDAGVTARRTLGTGPRAMYAVRGAQADLIDVLPNLRLPDLADLRARGVLGSPAPAHLILRVESTGVQSEREAAPGFGEDLALVRVGGLEPGHFPSALPSATGSEELG